MTTTQHSQDSERRDLLEALDAQRGFLLQTAAGLTDAQATSRPTVSALSIGGIIKHVAATERQWIRFIQEGPSAMELDFSDPAVVAAHEAQFRLQEGETLDAIVADYRRAAEETARIVNTLEDLGIEHPLPEAPWFAPGATRSARRVLQHILAETAQHSGHADIIRESIDGAKTMG